MMSDDPMKVFVQTTKAKQVPSAQTSQASALTPKAQSAPTQGPANLPDDWQDKLEEVCQFLRNMREEGSKVAAKFQMSDHEFEAYINNPGNFSSEDWSLVCEARKQTEDFVSQMKEILRDYKVDSVPALKKAKAKKGSIGRGWISVD